MTNRSAGVSSPMMTNVLAVLMLSSFVVCVKYSSKYSDNGLLFKIEPKRRSHCENETIDNNNSSRSINEYLDDVMNNVKQEFTFPNEDKTDSYKDYRNSIVKIWPVIYDCVDNKGITDCLKIFLIRRLDRVRNLIKTKSNVSIIFDDLQSEVLQNFKWREYKDFQEKELNNMIVKQLQGLMENKRIKLVLRSGIDVEMIQMDDETVSLNIRTDPELQLPRGMKASKMFYRVVPFLLIPPLIMSAILPFVLPAMKMMIMGAGMLNQMALGAAVFTLMRNGIFNDKYEKKVIYVNDGYKNEKKPPPIVHHTSYVKPPVVHHLKNNAIPSKPFEHHSFQSKPFEHHASTNYEHATFQSKPSFEYNTFHSKPNIEHESYQSKPTFEHESYQPKPIQTFERDSYQSKPIQTFEHDSYQSKPIFQHESYQSKPTFQHESYQSKPTFQHESYQPKPSFGQEPYQSKPIQSFEHSSFQTKPVYEHAIPLNNQEVINFNHDFHEVPLDNMQVSGYLEPHFDDAEVDNGYSSLADPHQTEVQPGYYDAGYQEGGFEENPIYYANRRKAGNSLPNSKFKGSVQIVK